ncbi:MAG: putative membrane protein YhhN [Bacteroidia bacterium]|jgi:uncharacterized membrane protein YhhN
MSVKRILILAFIIMGTVEVSAEFFELPTIIYKSKPWMMIILILLLLKSVDVKSNRSNRFMLLALVFCFFGDVLLMIQPSSEGLFIAGLFTFLVGHLMYTYAFYLDTQTPFKSKWKTEHLLIPIMLMAHALLIASLMVGNLNGVMMVAVLIYVVFITIMGVAAAARIRDGYTLDRIMLLMGALFFVFSDTLIGVTKFIDPDVPFARPAIMTQYLLGQILIILGWTGKTNPHTEIKVATA